MASIRFVLLDADGVIQVPAPGWRPSLEALCPDPERIDDFVDAIFASEKKCIAGRMEFEPLLSRVLDDWGIEVPASKVLDIWTLIEPNRGVLNVAKNLKREGYVVCLATNQQTHRAGYMRTALNYELLFDELFISCEMGVAKPKRQYFDSMVRSLDARPEECLFIDDNEGNVKSAQSRSLKAAVYHLDEGVDRLQDIFRSFDVKA